MNRLSTISLNIPKIKLNKILASCFLVASLFLAPLFNYDQAIASVNQNQSETTYPTNDKNFNGLLYSDSDRVKSLNNVDDLVSPAEQRQLLDPAQIPAKKQPILNRADPNAKLLEKTKQMFDDAANF